MSTDHDKAIVVLDGARTAIGTFGGSLRDTPAYMLGAAAIREALRRSGVPGEEVDEVVVGCVGQVGPEAFNARRAALAAGLPVGTPAYNVNRLCGSGLQALWNAACEIRAGGAAVVVAGGNENMSMQPFLDYGARRGYRLGDHRLVDGTLSLVTDPWGDYPMGATAEAVAERFKVSRHEQDELALLSQQRAERALDDGLFRSQVVPVSVRDGKRERTFEVDEHPRPGTTLEQLAALRPVFAENGTVTAGNSSGINDAGAAVVLVSEAAARAHGLKPKARLAAFSKAALEPEIMGYAPVHAVERALAAADVALSDIGVIELNEAFAAQAVAVIRDTKMDLERVNPNGGAIALGHPIGATGTILVLKAVYEMLRRQVEWGLVTMCIGGGQAVAAVFQAVA
ncbi:MAG: thiolase family protein [Acidimicrobiales bacterium]